MKNLWETSEVDGKWRIYLKGDALPNSGFLAIIEHENWAKRICIFHNEAVNRVARELDVFANAAGELEDEPNDISIYDAPVSNEITFGDLRRADEARRENYFVGTDGNDYD